jgi:hypothetical protein
LLHVARHRSTCQHSQFVCLVTWHSAFLGNWNSLTGWHYFCPLSMLFPPPSFSPTHFQSAFSLLLHKIL